jgi:hypothetical protein
MAEPGDHRAAHAGGHGRMRASHADREQVIEVLKDAFAQGRLTQDELDTRAGRALASRTYSELADLTADIPAGSDAAKPAVKPPAEPAGPPARTLAIAARRSGMCMLAALAVVGVIALTNAQSLLGLAVICGVAAVIAASGFLGYGVVDAWEQRRSRSQLPPRPRQHGRGLEDERPLSTERDPALPGARPDQTRVDLRTHRPGRDRRCPAVERLASALNRVHHRCTHAEGWRLEQPEPGVLIWRTPSGRSYTTTRAVHSA